MSATRSTPYGVPGTVYMYMLPSTGIEYRLFMSLNIHMFLYFTGTFQLSYSFPPGPLDVLLQERRIDIWGIMWPIPGTQ